MRTGRLLALQFVTPAGAAGFLILIQPADLPARYREQSRFDTMPSQPKLQACS
jgi:hypothetical protein